MKAKRTKTVTAPALSPLERYNAHRAEAAQTVHGGKTPICLSSTVRFKRNIDDKVIR